MHARYEHRGDLNSSARARPSCRARRPFASSFPAAGSQGGGGGRRDGGGTHRIADCRSGESGGAGSLSSSGGAEFQLPHQFCNLQHSASPALRLLPAAPRTLCTFPPPVSYLARLWERFSAAKSLCRSHAVVHGSNNVMASHWQQGWISGVRPLAPFPRGGPQESPRSSVSVVGASARPTLGCSKSRSACLRRPVYCTPSHSCGEHDVMSHVQGRPNSH